MMNINNNSEAINILFLEDSHRDFEIIRERLIDEGWDLQMDLVENEQEFESALQKKKYHIILSDFKLPSYNAYEALKKAIEVCPEIPFIIVSGEIGEEIAIDLIKLGAVDYVLKDKPDKLPFAINRALKEAKEKEARKLAEEKIRAAEENLKNTFDLSPSIISKANINTGYFIEANQAVTRILGYSVQEFTSKPMMEFIHLDDRERTSQEIAKQLKGKKTAFFENRYLCKDGSYHWMAWNVTKADMNGIVLAIGSDINDHKLVEIEFVKTKQFYKDVLEGVQDGIWVTDKEDVIFYANSAVGKIAGVPHEQFKGKNVLTEFRKETTEELIKYYKQAKKEKKPIWYEINIITIANRDTWQNGWLIPQYHNDTYMGVICTIRDVTERKKAEESVRRLSTAMQQSPSLIVISNKDGILEFVNPKFTELTGYHKSEIIGQSSDILKSGEQDAAFYQEIWETIKAGKVWRGQFHNRKKNGELFWEAATISSILDDKGETISYIKIGEDITQQKNTEIKLKAALKRALHSDRLKSSFLSNMSHEIRTPMNGILGFIDLLNDPTLSKDEIEKYTSIINKSSDRLLNTINDIIDISRIEAGEMIISLRETAVNEILEELHSFYSHEAQQKGLSLFINTPHSNDDIILMTDSHKLHGILTNLIKNAIKFTENGEITFGYVIKGNSLEFFVKDTGIGIPKDRLEAVFNRFEQADIGDSRVYEGSGLGLSISKAYIEMLGGEISVTSQEDLGSIFTFTLPITQKEKKVTEIPPEILGAEFSRTENLSLLVVEDDDISGEFLQTILKDSFKKITFASNGIEAIAMCKYNPDIDLVLMDMKMPKMNGYDATKEIRKVNKDLVIIAQTAYMLPGDQEKAIEAGCNDYISKPINKKLLLEMLDKHIS